MVFPRIFPTEIHALHLTMDVREFMSEWKACIEDRQRDMNKILLILNPFINHWYALLTDPSYPRDVQFGGLCSRLDKYDFGGLDRIHTWVSRVSDLRSELQYLVCEVVKSTQYYPNAARPIVAEYVFALLFRHYLRDHIARELRTDLLDLTDDETILYQESTELEAKDLYLLDKVAETRWEKYLLYLISNGFTTMEIANIVKLPRETFYYEEKHLWEQLKNLWNQPEL